MFLFFFLINTDVSKKAPRPCLHCTQTERQTIGTEQKTHLWSHPKFFKVGVMTPANLRFCIRLSAVHNTCKDGAGIHIGKKMFMRTT